MRRSTLEVSEFRTFRSKPVQCHRSAITKRGRAEIVVLGNAMIADLLAYNKAENLKQYQARPGSRGSSAICGPQPLLKRRACHPFLYPSIPPYYGVDLWWHELPVHHQDSRPASTCPGSCLRTAERTTGAVPPRMREYS